MELRALGREWKETGSLQCSGFKSQLDKRPKTRRGRVQLFLMKPTQPSQTGLRGGVVAQFQSYNAHHSFPCSWFQTLCFILYKHHSRSHQSLSIDLLRQIALSSPFYR